MIKKRVNKILGELFFTYFPEGKMKNMIKCFIANNYLFNNSDFSTAYRNNDFIVDYHQNIYKFCDYPSSDFYEILEGYLRKYTIKKGDIVIDCGAYQGSFSILASQLVGENGLVISFEPNPANYKKLLINLKQNNISNVVTINKGLWSKKTLLNFKKGDKGSSLIFEGNVTDSIITVPVVSLDQELSDLGVTKVNFIKADVEGSEIELIRGSKKTLLNNHVNLAIASYHILDGKKTYMQLEKALNKLGYTATTEFEDHLTTYAKK
jgi:FkbM family methyltransferase